MKKKSLKGMTLVEIVIAMAVMAIMSTVVVVSCSNVAKMKVSTNALNKKINYEAPVADSRSTSTSKSTETPNQKIVLKYGSNTYEVDGSVYEVNEESNFSNYGEGMISVQGNHNFKFFNPAP